MRWLPGIAMVAVAAAAAAQVGVPPGGPLPNVGPPLLLRLEGVFERPGAPAVEGAFTVVTVGFTGRGDVRRLAVLRARTVGGDHPLDGKDVLALVAPFTPNFLVTGPAAMTDRVRDAPAGSRIVVEGLVSRGSRTYYLRDVSVDPPPGGAAHSRRS
jgi:hypothetical protein